MESLKIFHLCDSCHKSCNEHGYFHISKEDVAAFKVVLEDWTNSMMEKARPVSVEDLGFDLPPGLGAIMVPLDTTPPPRPEWAIHHAECDPDIEGDDFFIPIELMSTWPGIVRATADLMDEPWIHFTNFLDRLSGILAQEHDTRQRSN